MPRSPAPVGLLAAALLGVAAAGPLTGGLPLGLSVGFGEDLFASLLEEPGDELAVDIATGGLSHVKARPPALEASAAGPIFGGSAQSSSSSSWWPAPAPAPAPGPAGAAEPDAEPPPAAAGASFSSADHPDPGTSLDFLDPAEVWPEWIQPWPLDEENTFRPQRCYYDEEEAASAQAYAGEHFWPTSRGRHGSYGLSPHTAPFELSTENLAWTWHEPESKYAAFLWGTAIDDKMNVYVTATNGLKKFSPDGELLWFFHVMKTIGQLSVSAACIEKGAIFCTDQRGFVYAVNIETGKRIWHTRVSKAIPGDNGYVTVRDGIVVCAAHLAEFFWGGSGSGSREVHAVRATDGTPLWKYTPDAPIWNFMASFGDDGTLAFQDYNGKAYRLRTEDGALLWKNGGIKGTWTDGTSVLGPNGIFYAVSLYGAELPPGFLDHSKGELHAYRWADGKRLWKVVTPKAPNNGPAFGRLAKGSDLSLVQPIGKQVSKDSQTEIAVYDAATGDLQWIWHAHVQLKEYQAGDWEGKEYRSNFWVLPTRDMSLPNPWSAPTVTDDGVIYIGNQQGQILSLRLVEGPATTALRYDGAWTGVMRATNNRFVEVSSFDSQACFSGSEAPSIAPGMVAVCSCDTLFVFRRPAGAGEEGQTK